MSSKEYRRLYKLAHRKYTLDVIPLSKELKALWRNSRKRYKLELKREKMPHIYPLSKELRTAWINCCRRTRYLINREKIQERNKLWKKNNKEKASKINKEYGKKYNQTHREERRIAKNKWRAKKRLEDPEWHTREKEKSKIRVKAWEEKYPERALSTRKRILDVVSLKLGMNSIEYESARRIWSRAVKKKDCKTCKVCGGLGEISHHILYKTFYPELSLNVNNGITLCKTHHKEVHMFDKFGVS